MPAKRPAKRARRPAQRPGRCTGCGCVDARACAMGCSWANPPSDTVCTACVNPEDLQLTSGQVAQRIERILTGGRAARAEIRKEDGAPDWTA